MSHLPPDDLSNFSMLDLFRVETETQTAALTSGLLELERAEASPKLLESLMRAAHSIKGAARIVNLEVAVRVAHLLEDCFVAAQEGQVSIGQAEIDILLRGVDLLSQVSRCGEAEVAAWRRMHAVEVEQFVAAAQAIASAQALKSIPKPTEPPQPPPVLVTVAEDTIAVAPGPSETTEVEAHERVVRLNADNLNRLLGLAGESLVETRWLRPFSDSMQRLKRMHSDLQATLDGFRRSLDFVTLPEPASARLKELAAHSAATHEFLTGRLAELDQYDRRSTHLSNRLYLEVLRTRMRPFSDGTQNFPRMVRDVARALGKNVQFEILGENTQVDRDILEKLETPLAHLLRNAVDHGCETPEAREAAGKPPEAVIQLEARHSAGMLLVTVTDDGAGMSPDRLRRVIVEKELTTAPLAAKMSEAELLEFLFLPGFTLKETVTEISGRGVGLDIVQDMVKSLRGTVRVATQPGRGMRFQLQLPLTLSVLRTLLVEIGGEPYAIPLGQIAHTLKLSADQIETLEGRQHFAFGDQRVGLLAASQVFDCPPGKLPEDNLPVVVFGERNARFGLVVDRFLGERELVVQPLDPRLGKVKDISAAALMEDGTPVLIVDVDDLLRSIEKLVATGHLDGVAPASLEMTTRKKKRVLAVDDSLTVRELERKLLTNRGYLADVAVDGMDGWNAVRTGVYDLVITDVDMPRMDGIELATLIKRDPHLKSLPVMIVSYKDREADRLRGLEAGADYYLSKGSFHDQTLLQAVMDLIGEPEK